MSNPNMTLPPTTSIMTDRELADYCHIQNHTASPMVAELVRRIDAKQTEDWEAEEVRANFNGYCYSRDVGVDIEVAKEQVMALVNESDDVDTIRGIFDDLYWDIENSRDFGQDETVSDQATPIAHLKPRKATDKVSSKPGPKDIYLPAILAVLREHQLPVPRNELVKTALRSIGGVKGRGIYAAISNAERKNLIVKVGSNRFRLPT